MSDPTAAEAAAWRLAIIDADPQHAEPDDDDFDAAEEVCDALGIDPDSPLSLLRWHATQAAAHRASRHSPTFTTRYGCTNHQAPTHAR